MIDYTFFKKKYMDKNLTLFAMFVVVISLFFAVAAESSDVLQSTLVRPDYEFKWVSTLEQNVTLRANYDKELAWAGENVYVTYEKTDCNTGVTYLMVIYKGNFWWIKKKDAKEKKGC